MSETVTLKAGRAKPAVQRHPWIYRGAIQHLPERAADGDVVRVVDEAGRFVAQGYLNRQSQITIRLLSWDDSEAIDEGFLAHRLERAIAWRRRGGARPPNGAGRLVYAESDGLPGLIIDRYADWLAVQFLTLGSERWRGPLLDWLVSTLKPAGIWERSDVDVREKEGLAQRTGCLWGSPPPDRVEVSEGGYRFLVDIVRGHKTGFYLDQSTNRQRVAAYCRDREVLNCFAYTGAFGVYAAGAGANQVWQADTSADALGQACANMALNGYAAPAERYVERDVFHLLREYRDRAQQFDLIILDPPKFAFAQSQVERACRGYKDINRLALQLLRPDGMLATFSCSGAIGPDLFQKVVFGAALDARRDVQIVEALSQAADHPVLLSFPESAYLKGLVCRAI